MGVTRRKTLDTVAAREPSMLRSGGCTMEAGEMARAFVGIGANLGEPERQIRAAIAELARSDGVEVVAVSSLRETEPVGYENQPRFLNGAVVVETELSPRELLELLLAIERGLGRVRGEGPRFGPRTIDLDLLLYGDETVEEPGLTVPHPRLVERRFALEPLAELDPELEIPGQGPVRALLAGL
jgi:2-amino-4-hydroxy-6-hydroxymethyldihydropteridine diphosphokinase